MTTYNLSYYKAALRGEKPEIHADHPQPGYYKTRNGRGGEWLPVAIWEKDGQLVCRVGKDMRDPLNVWTWCADKPVEIEAAKEAFRTGSWPGDVEVPASIGDNSGAVSIIDETTDYIGTAMAWLDKIGNVTSDQQVDMAANYAAHIVKLKSKVDAERDTKVRPHIEAQREINGTYKPVIEQADDAAKTLKKATAPYLRAKQEKAEAEARAKYEAELAERRKAEELARKLAEEEAARNNVPVEEVEIEVELPPAPVMADTRVSAGGQRGRKVSLRTVVTWEIEDYDKVLAAVAHHMDVVAAVEKAARQLCKAGQLVPGMNRIETKEAV